jgi:ribosomal protein L20
MLRLAEVCGNQQSMSYDRWNHRLFSCDVDVNHKMFVNIFLL